MFKRISKILIIVFAVLAMGAPAAEANVFGDCGWNFWKPDCWNNSKKKKLDLKIDFSSSYNNNPAAHWKLKDFTCDKFFDFDDIKPGDFGEGTISLHLKNQNAWGCAIIRPTRNDDKSLTEPEQLEETEDNSQQDKWDGELAQNLIFRIWADTCDNAEVDPGNNIYEIGCERILYEGACPQGPIKLPLADSENANIFTEELEPLQKDGEYFIGAEWNVPSTVGNIIQTDSYKADITFFAEQAEGNAGFLCADIDDQNPEKCLNGAERSCYTGLPATKDIGICRSGNQVCSRGEWGKCQGEMKPEKEICADNLDNDCDGAADEAGCKPPPCSRDSQCNDGNNKTEDKCVKGECVHKEKQNFWEGCWMRKC